MQLYRRISETSFQRLSDGAVIPVIIDPATQRPGSVDVHQHTKDDKTGKWVKGKKVATHSNGPDFWAWQAEMELERTHHTVMLAFENGIPLPKEWASYRKALREIVANASSAKPKPVDSLPASPAAPEGL